MEIVFGGCGSSAIMWDGRCWESLFDVNTPEKGDRIFSSDGSYQGWKVERRDVETRQGERRKTREREGKFYISLFVIVIMMIILPNVIGSAIAT